MRRRYPPGTIGYKRKIEGLAAVAEGIIYSRFVEAQNVFNLKDPEHKNTNYNSYVLSTDYGPANVTVIGLFGIIQGLEGNEYHLLDEFYYDVNDVENEGEQYTLIKKLLKRE